MEDYQGQTVMYEPELVKGQKVEYANSLYIVKASGPVITELKSLKTSTLVIKVKTKSNLLKVLTETMVLVLLFVSLSYSQVYMTAKGKTFHKNQNCMALSHSKTVYKLDSLVAVNKLHLQPCKICYRKSVSYKEHQIIDYDQERLNEANREREKEFKSKH